MDPHTVAADQARAFLDDHLGRPVRAVEPVGAGAWSCCFGFVDGERDLVVRFGRHLEDFEKDRRAAGFATAGLPVPEVLGIGPAFDGHFAISTRAYGVPLESLDTLDAWEAVLPSLLAALDRLRDADLSTTRGYGGWEAAGNADAASWRDHLLAVGDDPPGHRTHGWRRKLAAVPEGEALFRDAHACLTGLVPDEPGPRHLVHADLINRNVLVAEDRITAVFDWGCSRYGDFLYDVAWLEFWAPWYPALQALGVRDRFRAHCEAMGVHIADFDTRMRACLLHIGLDHLAYNAHTGDRDSLMDVVHRLRPILC